MKPVTIIFFALLFSATMVTAQQKLNSRGGMTYLVAPKPNNIIYHDTVFRGSTEFKHLFFRTGDAELLKLYDRHQSNKIAGQVLNFAGAIAIIVGISEIGDNRGLGWGLVGGGFLTSMAGSYLTISSQKNLVNAVVLFNNRYNKASLAVGVGAQSTGLVYNF